MRPDQPGRAAPATRVLILGGTAEARELAAGCATEAGLEAVSSLAGVTTSPRLPVGRVRTGGFGGAAMLAEHLRQERIAAVVDATHPFAGTITASAVAAARAAGVPLLVVRRPGWVEQPGDRWHRVPTLAAAAEQVPDLGERVFLTTGRRSLGVFAGLDGCWFLSRSVEPPTGPAPSADAPGLPRRLTVLLDRGPFTVDTEVDLLTEHRIDVLVTKDSGGSAAKLLAARHRGIPVVMVDRPPLPPGATTVPTVGEALAWLARVPRSPA
jgi:precorrin-6A/cobalt-precorrin-6A reductase